MFHDRKGAPGKRRSIILFEAGVGGLEQLHPRNDDDVEPTSVSWRVTLPKYFPDQSFSAISVDGVP